MSSGEEADSGTDVDQLLKDTFSGSKEIKSGKFDVTLGVKSAGEAGTVAIKVAGPFQSEGKGKVPKLDIQASFEGAGQSLEAGVTSTVERGFVSFSGTDYEIVGPALEAVHGQLRGGRLQGQQRVPGDARHRPAQVAHERRERRRGQGR